MSKLTGNVKYKVSRGLFKDRVILQVEEYYYPGNIYSITRPIQRTRWRDAKPEDLQFLGRKG